MAAAGGVPKARCRFEYEPDPKDVLDALLPRYVEAQVYRAVLENAAIRTGGAHDRDAQRVRQRKRVHRGPDSHRNKVRQASITTELMEIVSGAAALRLRKERWQLWSLKSGTGDVVQVIGPVVDVEFAANVLPEILDALEIELRTATARLEVQQSLGNSTVRSIAMDTTEGVRRGDSVRATGAPIQVPVGEETLGRMFNVIGETIDGKGPFKGEGRMPMHRTAPTISEQSSRRRFSRRHQGHRPHLHVLEGLEDRTLRRSRGRQDGHRHGDDPQHRARARRVLGLRRCRRAHP